MTTGPPYVLDANVFIEAKRRYYAFDINPGFWGSLVEHAQKGQVESIDRVKKELEDGNDNLAEWATGHFSQFFVSTDDQVVIQKFKKMMRWVNQNDQFSDAAKAEFADSEEADGWLVAYAKAKDRTVVTHEELNPDIQKKVPIPNVCREFDVDYVDTFDMLRTLNVQFTQN